MSLGKHSPYWFDEDGEDEPTMWRYPEPSPDMDGAPVSVLRRCENPEVFDFLKGLLEYERATRGGTHGDPFLSPWQTNPTAGTSEDAAAQLGMARDLTFNRDEEGEA